MYSDKDQCSEGFEDCNLLFYILYFDYWNNGGGVSPYIKVCRDVPKMGIPFEQLQLGNTLEKIYEIGREI